MIFSPDLVEAILNGRKTVTRRPRRLDEPCRYHEGRTYAVQPGRGKKGVGRIRVTSTRPELLRDLTPEDAAREGFASIADFQARWRSFYTWCYENECVWRIEFVLVGAAS